MQVDTRQTIERTFLAVFVSIIREHIEREHHVVEHRHRVEQRSTLENHAHLASQQDSFLLRQRNEIAVVIIDAAAGRCEQPHNILHQHGLAATALTDDEVDLAIAEDGIDVLEHVTVLKTLIQMFYFNHSVSVMVLVRFPFCYTTQCSSCYIASVAVATVPV